MKPKHCTPNAIEIGNNIRKVRQLKNYKQEHLADKLNITTASLSKIENGKTDISLSRLYEVAKALEIKIEKLFIDPCVMLNK